MKKQRYIILLLPALLSFSSQARDLLSSAYSPEKIQEMLVMHQKWIPFPDYYHRSAWKAFTASNRASIILRGKKKLNYEWKVIKATDYLAYEYRVRPL